MARAKHLTMGGMLVLLFVAVAVLPMVLKLVGFSVSGFSDMEVQRVPQPAEMRQSEYVPDRNTDYICRSPNDSGIPCPEGQFCDGTRQVCEKKTVPALGEIIGYFS